MQNMNGMQGMNIQMLGNMNGGMQNMQWQAVAGQGQQCGGCQPCMQSMQGMTQNQQSGGNSQQMQGMQNCQAQTIFAPMQPMQNVQFIQVPTAMSLPAGMQLMPMNCQQMMVPKEWNGNNGGNFDQGQNFMVKNNFVNQEQTAAAPGTRCTGSEKELVQQITPEGSEEDFMHEGGNSRQVSDTAMKNNGQFLIISGANSPLKAASGQSGLSMERQLQQLHLEQQQLLQQHHMQQQALAHQQQMELMYHSQQLEALKHSVNDGPQNDEIQETDDEDCIGQYPHQGPVAPTDGGMAWMTATLEGMHQCTPPQPNFATMISGPAASADTGSTPEPTVGKKKILRKKDEPQADAGSGASSAEVGMEKKKKASDPWAWEDGVVTVMVRQLPRQYTQRMLLQEVIRRGFEGLFDFLYLPYDFKKGINVGYGFVNFTEPEYALQFRDSLDGQFLDKYMRMKGKAVRVHPAQVQGYEANYRHFAHTKTGQKQDPAFSPLFFSVQSAVSSSELMKQMADVQLGRDGKIEHGNGNVHCNTKDRSPSGLGVQEHKDKSTQNETLMPLIRLKGMPEMNAAQAMARPFGGDDETGRRKANRRNNKKSGEMLGAQGGAWVGLQGQPNWMESPKGQVKVESSASSQQPFF